jgi:hypothetical protein
VPGLISDKAGFYRFFSSVQSSRTKPTYMPLPPPIKATSSNSLILKSNLGKGPLMERLSPGFIEWIYFDALPLSYFLIKNTNSPSFSEGEMGV